MMGWSGPATSPMTVAGRKKGVVPVGKGVSRCRGKAALTCVVAFGLLVLMPGRADADLKLCNGTPSRIGVALGYQDKNGWATEGWWNIPSETCENVLRGTLPSRYLYIFAVDYERGGEWSGQHYMCTKDSSFTIRNNKNCDGRGFDRKGFYEIDTGTSQSWTIRLDDPEKTEKTAE
jgi:uncharacterized membrane protein